MAERKDESASAGRPIGKKSKRTGGGRISVDVEDTDNKTETPTARKQK